MRTILTGIAGCAVIVMTLVGVAKGNQPSRVYSIDVTVSKADVLMKVPREVAVSVTPVLQEVLEVRPSVVLVNLPMPPPRVAAKISGARLLAAAEHYKGTNPTGWVRLWCARFMSMIAPKLAKKLPNPNWARNWVKLPRAKKVEPGVIVVLSRGRGGHIGVLKKVGKHGNLIIVSGNHGRRVAEGSYPRSRVIAYIDPTI